MKRPSRRRFLGACAVGIAGLAGCQSRTGFPPPDCTEDELVHESDADLTGEASWPAFQYDVANTGYNPTASGPKDDVQVAWQYPACTEAESGVVVHDGMASAGGLVVNGRTGRPVGGEWDSHAGTPTFAAGRLYVGAHDRLARDAGTGELDWRFETESDSGGLNAPAVVDGTVYVPGQFDDPTLYAVDASEGTETWRYETDAAIETPPAVAEATVFVVDETSTILAIDASTGDERWRRSPAEGIRFSIPVVADETLYLGSDGGDLLALDTEDGSDVWRRNLGSSRVGPVAVADETVYLPGPTDSLLALSARDGNELWRHTVGSGPSGPPVVADDVVYVGAGRRVHALDASEGDERWQFETREVSFGDYPRYGINGFAVVDGLLYVASAPADLYALEER